ncbi:MAG: hypothetical protein ACE5NA_04685 [Nitrospiraceae bacterium]
MKTLLTGIFILIFGLAGFVACGSVSSPVPPEDLGVAVKLEQAKQREAREQEKKKAQEAGPGLMPEVEQEQPRLAPRGEGVELPPLRPSGGTR